MKKISVILFIGVSMFYNFSLKSQETNNKRQSKCICLQSRIKFDNSSIEKIVMQPEEILADPDAFWMNDSAYQLVKLWHQDVSLPIPMNEWKTWIQSYKNLSHEEREKDKQLMASRYMMQKEKEFNEKAIPYICSFLPKESSINTTVYFTTAIMASGFQMENNIVLYGANSDKDNLIIHELFHQGFNNTKPKMKECVSKDSIIYDIYNDIQNEGMATYVGYMALNDFPNFDPDPKRDDYGFLQDSSTFYKLHDLLNETLRNAPSLLTTETGQKEIKDTLWQVGSMDRAYYVIGCFMAKTIDEKSGRKALVETITSGPQSFLHKYNSLVDEELKIVDIYSQN